MELNLAKIDKIVQEEGDKLEQALEGSVLSQPTAVPVVPETILLEAARDYISRGWRVFPLQPKSKIPLGGTRGVLDATSDPSVAGNWWDVFPDANIGIATGEGLVVLDVDSRHGGEASLEELVEKYGTGILNTLQSVTGGGGSHLYYKTDRELRNRAGVLPGIDIRGAGGYVVGPPSVHSNGRQYEWEESLRDAPLLAWPFDFGDEKPSAITTLAASVIPAGTRNATLSSLAGSMRNRGFSKEAIEVALQEENSKRCNPPLPESEVKAIAASISRYEPKAATSGTKQVTLRVIAKPATDWLAEKYDPPSYLIHNIWPEHAIGFVAGPPKSFKSFYTLEMAYAISTGQPFLTRFNVKQSKVLLIQAESSRGAFRDRLLRTQIRYGQAPELFIISNRQMSLEDPADLDKLRYEISVIRPSLVILDPLASFHGSNENDSQSMGGLVKALRGLRDEFGAGFCVVHHNRKSDGLSSKVRAGDSMRGSTALYAAAEVMVILKRVSDDVQRSTTRYELKDGEGPQDFSIQFEPENGLLRIVTNSEVLSSALAGKENYYSGEKD